MRKIRKNVFIGILLTFIIFICVGCSSNTTVTKNNENSENVSEELKKDIPEGDFSDMGKGTFVLKTASGTSENGSIPVIFVGEQYLAGHEYASPVDIGISTRDFDGSILTNLYVDGVLQEKEQLADTDTSLYVSEKLSKVGKHKVELLQFDDNNNVVTYKSAEYEIKAK